MSFEYINIDQKKYMHITFFENWWLPWSLNEIWQCLFSKIVLCLSTSTSVWFQKISMFRNFYQLIYFLIVLKLQRRSRRSRRSRRWSSSSATSASGWETWTIISRTSGWSWAHSSPTSCPTFGRWLPKLPAFEGGSPKCVREMTALAFPHSFAGTTAASSPRCSPPSPTWTSWTGSRSWRPGGSTQPLQRPFCPSSSSWLLSSSCSAWRRGQPRRWTTSRSKWRCKPKCEARSEKYM